MSADGVVCMVRWGLGRRVGWLRIEWLIAVCCLAGMRPGLGLEAGKSAGLVEAASSQVNAAEVASALGLLCSQGNLKRDAKGAVSGCRVCPAGTSFAGDKSSSLDVGAETAGHFTSAETNNLILDTNGCEPHAANFGGSYVFAMEGGKARLVRYNAGLVTSQCHRFAFADARNYLICEGGWAGQGEVDSVVSMVSFTASGKSVAAPILSLQDTTGECLEPDANARDSEVKGIRFTPADAEQITGMTITATLGSVRCSVLDKPDGQKAAEKIVKTYEVEFVFDGKQFKVAPGSRAAMERLTPKD